MIHKYQTYLGNLESVLEEVILPKFNLQNIRQNSLIHTFAQLRHFADSNYNEQDRIDFVQYIFKLTDSIELKLVDLKFDDIEERLELLLQIKTTTKAIFNDINITSKKPLTTDEKVILLDYLGVFKLLESNNITQKNQAKIMELLLERNSDNLKKSISNKNGKIKTRGTVKNEVSLNTIKKVVDDMKIVDLIEKIEIDLNELNKSK